MKKIFSALLTLLLLAKAGNATAQGIEFFHGTWAEALDAAKKEEKIIFVDAFAVWCGPCKRMAAQTFPDPQVGEFFNANFINLKIDMEKPENGEFASKYPVSSYPTLMFIDAGGKIVMKEIGAKDVQQLLQTGQKALGRTDKTGDFEKRYQAGDRDPKLVFDYVRALNAAGKSSLKITNEYLKGQKDLGTEFNLRFIHEGATEADSRVFDLLLKYRKPIADLLGENALNARIEKATRNTLKKAISFKNEALLEETKAKMKSAQPDRAEAFAIEADMAYYKATKDAKQYLKAAQAHQKMSVKGDPDQLDNLVASILRAFPEDEQVLEQAEKWAKQAAEKSGKPLHYLTLAEVYKRQGNDAKAKSTAKKAVESIQEEDRGLRMKIEQFLNNLN